MRFMTAYLTGLFLVLFSAAQLADHVGAKQCEQMTSMSYNQCRQHRP